MGYNFDLSNPHDRYFRKTFGKKENIQDFLEHILPKKDLKRIDLETLKSTKESFIDDKYNEYRTDVIFKVNLSEIDQEAYICCLFEHKSTPEKFTVLQVLNYMVRIWINKEEEIDNLPLVIPIIFYHGYKSWNVPVNLSQFFNVKVNVSEITYFPEYQPLLVQMEEMENRIDEFSIIGVRLYLRAVNLFRAVKEYERTGNENIYWKRFYEYTKVIKEYEETLNHENKKILLQMDELLAESYIYILYCTPEVLIGKVEKVINEEFPERGEGFMQVKDNIFNKIKEENLEKGRQKGLLETTQKMLEQEFGRELSDELCNKLKDVSYEKLENILLNIRSIENEEDVFELL